MRKDKLITINSKTSEVFFDNGVLGIDGENLQGNLIFKFNDEFVNGTARVEIEINGTKSYAMLTKEEETYTLPIKSFLTKVGNVDLQLVITEGTNIEEIPIFKSKIFYLRVYKAINAEIEQPEEYDQWIDIANAKLNELDVAIDEANTLDIESEKVDTTTTITITKKDGTTEEVEILDGEKGANGKDAKINGVNTLTLEAGDNITLEQEGSTLTINSTGGGGGTGDYTDLTNKPKINNVELSGNKSTSDLGIVIPDVSNFITKDANNLTYYTKTSDLSNVATSGSYNDLSNKPDLSTKQDKIDSTHKLDADLVDDTNSTNKFVSASDKTTWNEKQDTLTAGTGIDITNNVISATGGENTKIFMLTTNFNNVNSAISFSQSDIQTLNKFIDSYLANENCILMAKKMRFRTSSTDTFDFYNVSSYAIKVGNTLTITFYRPFLTGSYNSSSSLLGQRSINLPNVSSPSQITSATLPAQGILNADNNIILQGNTISYNVTGDYNPAHKKYVDDSINPTITTDSSTTDYTIASLTGNQSYKLGELTSLTITAITTFDRESIIYFTSGTTPTDISIPDTIVNLGDVPTMTASGGVNTGTCEASKSYIIAILNNIAVWKAY